MMWHTVLQDASFKGVRFDVMSLEESDGKALVEHAYPFANGTHLEDMGTKGRQIQVSAVFWGKQYHSRLNALIEALMEQGSGVLVHPIWGRMPHMLPESWHFRHEADNVDYATLDITFRESGEPHKIFVFENQFLMELERLIARIDGYRAALEGFIDSLNMVKQDTAALLGSAMGLWGTARGVWTALRDVFALPYPKLGDNLHPNWRDWADDVDKMSQRALFAAAGMSDTAHTDSRPAKSRFDEAMRQADALLVLPRQVALKQAHTAQRPDAVQMAVFSQILRLLVLANVLQVACYLIEQYGDNMNAPDLLYLNRSLRVRVQSEIAALRDTRHKSDFRAYQHRQNVIESLRQASGSLNVLVIAAINQKPPLIARPAPLNGTVQQIAFAFYGDFTRSNELIRLNPHITHPNFIKKGDFINAYAK
ncbi:MAG: DNA circularization N-terminal domain-containing protein [Alysiella sp.]|uniref:DNA circularization protein n=1 Tax=Alysiella sp. TaxID=1872483 RepID=UPI0026DCDDBC|nr:DNA circularization N-terminal domain-containing protein [Alysiella sp.]MDO4434385.1 DNA circularization N-terminal domain-containing protein [Alysiella sp.]